MLGSHAEQNVKCRVFIVLKLNILLKSRFPDCFVYSVFNFSILESRREPMQQLICKFHRKELRTIDHQNIKRQNLMEVNNCTKY